MNISTWSKGKKLLVLALVLFFFVGVGVTVYLVQKQQETQSHAQKATVITLTPANQSVAAGGEANVNVSLNPGTNQVNFVKIAFEFDKDVFDASSLDFTANSESNLAVISGPTETDNGASVVLSVGNDPTKVIQSTTNLGTFKLPIKSSAATGSTDITINKTDSQVRSIGGSDAFNENVLDSVVNAQVTVGAGACIPNQSTCSWDSADGATGYHYKITASDGSSPIPDGDTSETSVKFPSVPGETYTCKVTATNDCGTSAEANGTSTCRATPTPTPSLSPTPTPTVTPTVTPTPTTRLTTTPTPVVVTPTTVLFVTASPAPTNVIVQGPTTTPAPTLPPTGNPVVVGGLLGGLLFVLGGLALLFL